MGDSICVTVYLPCHVFSPELVLVRFLYFFAYQTMGDSVCVTVYLPCHVFPCLYFFKHTQWTTVYVYFSAYQCMYHDVAVTVIMPCNVFLGTTWCKINVIGCWRENIAGNRIWIQNPQPSPHFTEGNVAPEWFVMVDVATLFTLRKLSFDFSFVLLELSVHPFIHQSIRWLVQKYIFWLNMNVLPDNWLIVLRSMGKVALGVRRGLFGAKSRIMFG